MRGVRKGSVGRCLDKTREWCGRYDISGNKGWDGSESGDTASMYQSEAIILHVSLQLPGRGIGYNKDTV